MFKKLKEKVIDSQTSQKFQQITQSVSDKLQSLDKDENFFSLTEDDNAMSSTSMSMEAGFSNVSLTSTPHDNGSRHRRTSVSSLASDTSFLPRYDSVSSVYHLQSDLDISASELEDNASTASSQIGHLSKQQIYAAFQKSQMRYHKYRGRFTDLANHYKNLEREFTKLKVELEKNQERSFRRVKELKEQCELEQKAKAHLESSLRIDLDEKQIEIKTLKEKITLLQNSSNLNVDFEQLTKNLNDAKQENDNLNSVNQEMKAKLIVLQSKEEEYKEKIKKFAEDIERVKEDEKENNLKLAQSKMEIHNELLSKDAELHSLQQENESLKKSLDVYETKTAGNGKIEQLQSQNKNLIEKVENLSQKCQSLDNELLKVEQFKIEIQNLKTKISEEKNAHDQEIIAITKEAEGFKEKLFKEKQEKEDIIDNLEKLLFTNKKTYEKEISDLKIKIDDTKKIHVAEITKIRDDAKKGLLSIEGKIRKKFEEEFREKEEKIKMDLEEKFEALNSENNGVNELQIKLLQCQDELKKLEDEKNELIENEARAKVRYSGLETSYLELNEEMTEVTGKCGKLEKKLLSLEGVEEKIARLQANISTLQQENASLGENCKKSLDDKLNTEKVLETVRDELKVVQMTREDETTLGILKSQVKKLEKERNNVMHELDALKEEFEKLSEYNSSDKKKMQEYKQKFEESEQKENYYELLVEEKKKLEKSLEEINKTGENEKKILEENLRELREKYEEICRINEEKIQENSGLEGLIEKLTEELSKTQNIQHLELDYNKLLQEKENLNKLYHEMEEKLKIAEMKLENEECERNECKMLDLKLRELQGKHEELFAANKEALEQNLTQSKKVEELTKEIEIKIQYIKNLEENYKILDKNEKDYKKDVEKYKTESDLKSKDLIKLENNFADIQKMYSTEKKDIMKQIGELKKVEKNYYSLLDENENLKEQISEIVLLQEKLKSLSDVEVEKRELEEKFKQLNEDNGVLRKEYGESKGERSQLLEEVDKLKKSVNNNLEIIETYMIIKEDIFELAHTQIDPTDVELMKKIDLLMENEENNVLSTEREVLKDILKKISGKYTEIQNKIEGMEKTKKILEEDHKILQEQHETLSNASKSEKEEFNTKYLDLETKYDQINVERNKLIQQLAALEAEKLTLENKLTTYFEETEHNKTFVKTLKSEKEELNSKINVLERSKREFESTFEQECKEKNRLLEEMEELKEKLKILNNEKQNLQESYSKYNEIQSKYDRSLIELEEVNINLTKLKEENEVFREKNKRVSSDFKHISEENGQLVSDLEELKLMNENYSVIQVELEEKEIKLNKEKEELQIKLEAAKEEIDKLNTENFNLREIKINKVNTEVEFLDVQQNYYEIKTKHDELSIENKKLVNEVEELGKNIENFKEEKRKFEHTITEFERHQNELLNEKQLLKEEIEELKISPINLTSAKTSFPDKLNNLDILKHENGLTYPNNQEMDVMVEKLTQLKSLDITNKATIEFYENELQKVKTNNEKLNRRLDETLVTLNHCSELSQSTELEYLKNILYNYMLGKEGMILARVIATVCKFDDEQTEEILKKEQQKQTLLSKLGLL